MQHYHAKTAFLIGFLLFGLHMVLPIHPVIGQEAILSLPFTVSGSLNVDNMVTSPFNWDYNYTDHIIYEISLTEGDSLRITLEVPADADFDLIFYREENSQVAEEYASTGDTGADETLWVMATVSGPYKIFIGAYEGSGLYTLSIRTEAASPFAFIGAFFAVVFAIAGGLIAIAMITRRIRWRKAQSYLWERSHQIINDDVLEESESYPGIRQVKSQEPESGLKDGSEFVAIPVPVRPRMKGDVQFCHKCGAPLSPSMTKCPYCGLKEE